MPSDIYQTLSARYIPEKPLKTYSIIATEEKGIHYRANITPPRGAAIFQVDGCIITDGMTLSPPLSERRMRCTNSTARSLMR